MQFFYWINGLAGNTPLLDAAMPFIYAGAAPLLATILAAWLLLLPRDWTLASSGDKKRLAAASVLALILSVATVAAVHAFVHFALHDAVISHRPFMTHYVTALVAMPNNNAFPCFMMIFAAACATLLWAARPAAGVVGWIVAVLLGLSCLYCGVNFPADVVIGGIWGFSLAALSAALCGVNKPQAAHQKIPLKSTFQGSFAVLAMICVIIYSLNIVRTNDAGFDSGFATLPEVKAATLSKHKPTKKHSSKPHRRILLATKFMQLDGYLPRAQKYLTNVLERQSKAKIIGVNVAEVKVGKVPWRAAAIRFAVKGQGGKARKAVTKHAAHLVRAAFHADSRLDHIDIVGIKNHLPDDDKNHIYGAGGIPVFTASIDRKKLHLSGKHAWLNRPKVNAGLWLRARSLLYFDPDVLPSQKAFAAQDFLKKSTFEENQ